MTTKITLYHGDCLEVMPTLDPGSVAMLFADLPYKGARFHSTDCKWDVVVDLVKIWASLQKICKANAAYVFTAAHPFTFFLINSNLKTFKYCLVWDKNRPGNFTQAKRMPMRFHEDVVVFYEKQPVYNPQMVLRDKPRFFKGCQRERSLSGGVSKHDANFTTTYTHRYPSSILKFSMVSDPARGLHPTQKPVDLLKWLIKTYTNPGDTVLDPVMGSGTTGVACKRLGRHFIGIEKDETYFNAAAKRIDAEPWPTTSNP